MSIDNPIGGTVSETNHTVKTLGKAKEWFVGCEKSHLPVRIVQQDANGRLRIRVYDSKNAMIHCRG